VDGDRVTIAELSEGKLTGSASRDDGVIRARIAGTASQRDVAPLEAFVAALHAACVAGGVASVILDVRALAYVSSSHFKVLVSWIGRMRALPSRVGVTILATEKVHWQKRSLQALWHLAEDLITIESS
jgi:hypothetical protein